MIERARLVGIGAVVVAIATIVALDACSSEEQNGASGPGAGGSGAAPDGGSGGGGGAAGTGGSAGGSGPDCPHQGPPVVDPAIFDPCQPSCDGAHCVPASLVPPETQAQLAPCTTGGDPGFCTPDPFIESGGNFIPASCTSVAGAEGRCLSECLPAVAAQAVLLPQGSCAAGERCVPCFDPFSAEPTGACLLSCDPGPVDPPVTITCPWEGPAVIDPAVLPDCEPACAGAHCLPAQFVAPADQAQLAPCTGGFCAPDGFIAGGGQALPATCDSAAGAEGRCLSECLPAVAAQASLLPVDVCASGERCVPCFDPTASDPTAPTGACELACDAAVEPPVMITCPWNGPPVLDPAMLPACNPACGGAHCLPAQLVPPSQQGQLATCSGGFCVPDPVIAAAGNNLPATCTAFPGTTAEGRCLSGCLPDVAAQSASLQQDVCQSGEYCVPCYDPFDATATGACSSSPCDQPASPPYTFPTCCPFNMVDGGTCLPTAMIPQAQQGNLLQQSCPGNFLCVPNEYLPDPPIPISTCNSILGAGACVSQCTNVPGIFTQGNCPGNHVCVPCLLAPSTPGCP